MNVFGFPADDSTLVTERNLALHDARLALDWVWRDIAFLGGDPSKVTLVGESAGSWTIESLLTAPPLEPLPFRAAIMTSGLLSVSATPRSITSYIEASKTLVNVAGLPSKLPRQTQIPPRATSRSIAIPHRKQQPRL
ncbi:hypothetical protein ASPCAL05883 [Aspergillus calidoustus]|uniref:Carboxylesterase type B domain-containing protein n=1 Tax=Aspergillus calidoustus TaxID=454130 RepID=A0A0U5FZI8_ASPCI|nr:hypothetical protein ASPCAL05883 [Aspergillus calidoustus]